MPTLPLELTSLIVGFAPLFSKPVFKHVQVLIVGAILSPGKRTVTAALRVMGRSDDQHFENYHRVLNRACWSSLSASRILLSLLVAAFAPTGVLVMGLDEHHPSDAVASRLKPKASTVIRCAPRARTLLKRAACGGFR